jgi:hypothetical protein
MCPRTVATAFCRCLSPCFACTRPTLYRRTCVPFGALATKAPLRQRLAVGAAGRSWGIHCHDNYALRVWAGLRAECYGVGVTCAGRCVLSESGSISVHRSG